MLHDIATQSHLAGSGKKHLATVGEDLKSFGIERIGYIDIAGNSLDFFVRIYPELPCIVALTGHIYSQGIARRFYHGVERHRQFAYRYVLTNRYVAYRQDTVGKQLAIVVGNSIFHLRGRQIRGRCIDKLYRHSKRICIRKHKFRELGRRHNLAAELAPLIGSDIPFFAEKTLSTPSIAEPWPL